jgi:2-keto-4-pentenoate hydratase/2-oxohepta-3-ene-1,7-dioic acid hydratase in catechol pathway
MRLVTFREDGAPRLGAVVGERVIDLARASDGSLPDSMLALIDAGEPALGRARDLVERRGGDGIELSRVTLLAPIPRPRKNIFCLGLNYRDHAAEGARAMGKELKLPEHPIYFSKPPTCVIGPEEAIVYDPRVTQQVDWEVEFTLVLGRGGRDIPPDRVMEHIFGYTVGNDVSARDLQFRHGGQWLKGKSLDTFAPIGPWIVTADELSDPGNLDVRLRVNGVQKQSSNTREFIFDIPTMVSSLAAGITLEPGDLIMTGTPDGVGFARTPPEFLQDGDVVEAEVEGIGVLRNPVRVRSGG